MTESTPLARLPALEGRWETQGGVVWWRLGRRLPAEDATAVSRTWVEEIVREHGLFDWRGFAGTPRGAKPRFTSAGRADFNTAHSGDVVLVAVGMGMQIGVDVEIAPFRALESSSLRRRMLTSGESDRLATLHVDAQLTYLARVWTAKEAFVKAGGEGMRRDFRRFDVPVLMNARSQTLEACLVARRPRRPPEFLRIAHPAEPATRMPQTEMS